MWAKVKHLVLQVKLELADKRIASDLSQHASQMLSKLRLQVKLEAFLLAPSLLLASPRKISLAICLPIMPTLLTLRLHSDNTPPL